MYIKTTINIHKDIKAKTKFAAGLLDISRSQVIINLLKKLVDEDRINDQTGKGVKYQDSDNEDMWDTFHIKFREDEYEMFCDLKKFHRCTVSYMVWFVAVMFLDELIVVGRDYTRDELWSVRKQLKQRVGDNYRFHSYIYLREMVSGVISWRSFWGLPPNLSEILQI